MSKNKNKKTISETDIQTDVKIASRQEILVPFVFTLILATILYFGLKMIEPMVSNNNIVTGFGDLLEGYASKNPISMIEYLFFDISQLSFFFGVLPCVAMILGSYLAAHLEVTNSKYQGTGVSGHGKIFPVMITFAILSTLVSQLIYTPILGSLGFLPTLASFLFFHHLVMFYGVSKEKIATIFVAVTLLATPCCLLARILIVDTLNMPVFICVAVGAIYCIPICHLIFNFFPFMTPAQPGPPPAPREQSKFSWFMNQLLGDLGQLSVNGSSIASLALIVFSIISFCLNPNSTGVGMGLLPITLFTILVSGALTIFLYYPNYTSGEGPVLSFGSMITAAAIAVTYPENLAITVISIVFCSIVTVPVISWVFKTVGYRGQYCVFHIVTLALSIVVIPWALFVQKVIMPLI